MHLHDWTHTLVLLPSHEKDMSEQSIDKEKDDRHIQHPQMSLAKISQLSADFAHISESS